MSFIYFIRLITKNLIWLVLIPVVMAVSIFYFTRNEKKLYSSETVIYTGIASGYSLSGSNKADFYATSNAFDNLLSMINSRETKQEVAISLLADHLLIKEFDPARMTWGTFDQFEKLIPDSIRRMVVKPTSEATFQALYKYMAGKEGNLIYKIINSDNAFYSLSAMANIKAERVNNSDLIKISYQTNDAEICRQTLDLLIASFMKKQRSLKEGQSESVVAYFELETSNAFKKLNDAEHRFMEFNQKNNIINFYEQTKAVAGEKEALYSMNHTLEMDRQANSKTLAKVNDNIKSRLYQDEYGSAILKKREELSGIQSEIAVGEIIGKKDSAHLEQMSMLRAKSAKVERELQVAVNSLYSKLNTPNGIPTKGVLDEWLKSTLQVEQSNARLTVMGKRKSEFEDEYRKYAPLGAILKKIEREISVSEAAYLELLHGLNMAKLTQQNNQLTAKMNVVDAPFLPLKANASKRMLQVIVGFMVGFILVLVFILARVLINKSLQQPTRAGRIIGIPLIGIYPLLNAHPDFITKANLRFVQQLLSQIDDCSGPITIGMMSIQNKEGKTMLMDMLYTELSRLDYKVEKQVWGQGINISTIESDIKLIEFPPLETMLIKPGMVPHLNIAILVCRANRIWGNIDKSMLDIFVKTTGNKPGLVLNGVDTVFAEEYIGEVAKKRLYIRSVIKRLVKFEFGNRKKFTR